VFPKKEEDESEKEINICMMYNVCRFTELTEKLVFFYYNKKIKNRHWNTTMLYNAIVIWYYTFLLYTNICQLSKVSFFNSLLYMAEIKKRVFFFF
jgi:hypothetical protein